VYVDVEANTRKFTKEAQAAARRSGSMSGEEWGKRFAKGRDRQANWNRWSAEALRTATRTGAMGGRGFGQRFRNSLNLDGRTIFKGLLSDSIAWGNAVGMMWGQRFRDAAERIVSTARDNVFPRVRDAVRFGAETGRFWSDAFRASVGSISDKLLGAGNKASAKAEFAAWGSALGRVWSRALDAASNVTRTLTQGFPKLTARFAFAGAIMGHAWRNGFGRTSQNAVEVDTPAARAAVRSAGARHGFSYGRAFVKFAKIAMPTNWLPKRMDSTVRAVILSLVAAGGPLVALLSSLAAGLTSFASAVVVAAAGIAVALAPAIGALGLGLGALAVGFTALSDAKGELKSFKDAVTSQFKEMQKAVAEPLFAGLTGPVTDAMKNLTPLLEKFAGAANRVAKTFFEMFNSLSFKDLGNALVPLFETIGNIGTVAFRGITDLMIAAAPATQRLLDNISGLAGAFAAWMADAANQKALQDFLTTALDLASQLSDVFKPLGSALMDVIGVAISGPAQELLTTFAELTTQFKEFTSSAAGQETIKAWLGSVAVLGKALGPVFTGLGKGLANMVTPAAEKALIGLGEAIGALLPIIGTLFNSLAESGILDVFTSLVVQLANALQTSGLMNAFGLLAGAIGDALLAMLPVVVDLFNAMAPVIVTLASSLAQLLPPLIDALLPVFEGIADTLVQLAPLFAELMQALIPLITPLLVPLGELLKVVGQNTDVLIPLVRMVVDIFKSWTPILVPLIGAIGSLIGLVTTISRFFGELGRKTMEAVGSFVEMVLQSDLVQGVLDGIGSAIEGVSGFIKTLTDRIKEVIDWFGRIEVPDALRTAGDIVGNIGSAIGSVLGFASGGVVMAPTRALIGEAGPEAVIPLTRPLSQVDPSVRSLAAMIRGEGGSQFMQVKQNAAGPTVNVYPVQSDPEAVAYSVANRLAVMVG
jgi:phage-related protein